MLNNQWFYSAIQYKLLSLSLFLNALTPGIYRDKTMAYNNDNNKDNIVKQN